MAARHSGGGVSLRGDSPDAAEERAEPLRDRLRGGAPQRAAVLHPLGVREPAAEGQQARALVPDVGRREVRRGEGGDEELAEGRPDEPDEAAEVRGQRSGERGQAGGEVDEPAAGRRGAAEQGGREAGEVRGVPERRVVADHGAGEPRAGLRGQPARVDEQPDRDGREPERAEPDPAGLRGRGDEVDERRDGADGPAVEREERARGERAGEADASAGGAGGRDAHDGGSSLGDPVQLPGRVPGSEEGEGELQEAGGDAGQELEAGWRGGRDRPLQEARGQAEEEAEHGDGEDQRRDRGLPRGEDEADPRHRAGPAADGDDVLQADRQRVEELRARAEQDQHGGGVEERQRDGCGECGREPSSQPRC